MKKKLSIVLAFFLLCFIVLLIGVSGDAPLSPSVEKVLSFQLQAPPPEDNIYVGLAGLARIEDGDVVAAGEKFLKGGYRPDSEPRHKFDTSYRNPCFAPRASENHSDSARTDGPANCLDQLAAEARAINEAVEKNAAFIERYRAVQKMPLYVNTTTGVEDPVPMYQPVIEYTRLVGAKALLDIKQGNVSAGLEALDAELGFFKKMCGGEHVGVIDLMIAVAGLQINMNGLSKIIEDPQIDLAGHENLLRQMLNLNLNGGRIMAAVIESEKRLLLPSLNKAAEAWIGEEMSLKNRLKFKFFKFLYKKNMTLNRVAAKTDEVIWRWEAAPMLGFPEFIAVYAETEIEELTVKKLYDRYGLFFFKNYAGEVLANIAQPLYTRYPARINDAVVYSHLLRAALELRLMDDRPDDPSRALAGLGTETWNPYTGQPFNWDRERKTIWGEKANPSAGADPLSRRMEIRI